jgi:hypothetical protein
MLDTTSAAARNRVLILFFSVAGSVVVENAQCYYACQPGSAQNEVMRCA